jgi:hypothetical protein
MTQVIWSETTLRASSHFVAAIGTLFLLASPTFAADDVVADLSRIQQQISELESQVSPSDTSLVGALRAARLELLRTISVSLEERVRAEKSGANIELVERRVAPDPSAAASLLDEILRQQEIIKKTEGEINTLGGLTLDLAMSRLETEKLTLAGLRAGWMQAEYGLALPVAARPSVPSAETKELTDNEEMPLADAQAEKPSWADPNHPEIDYNSKPYPLFSEAGYAFLGHWAVQEENAELDDNHQILAVNVTAWRTGDLRSNPLLSMGCIENQARFFFSADDDLVTEKFDRIRVDYQIDQNQAVSTWWFVTTTSRAAGIFGDEAPQFMRKLMDAESISVRITERNGERHVARFLLAGTTELVDKIAALCGFSGLELGRNDLQQIQTLLNAAGYNAGTPDGVWGAGSRRAIQAFQEASGLTPTGIVDHATIKALGL